MPFKYKSAVVGLATILTGLVCAAPSIAEVPTPLGAMPSGSVTVHRTSSGGLSISLSMLGLTPSGKHAVVVSTASCSAAAGGSSVHTVQANATGQLQASFSASRRQSADASSVSLLLGTPGSSGGGVSPNRTIACANLPEPLKGSAQLAMKSELGWGSSLAGSYTITYDANAQTLTVDVSARGFVPGSSHAAHIHAGSCQSQGPVLYMLPDLVANASGTIHATRTVTGVTSAPPASGWYLNIHLGDSNQILSGGNPTLAFQPLLCADVDQIDDAPTAVAVGSDGVHFLSAGQTVVLGTVGHFTFSSTCSKNSTGQNQATFDVTANTVADLDGGGLVPAGQKVNIHTDSDALDSTTSSPLAAGAFAQVGSASSSTELAPDGEEVDVFYNDGVNWPASASAGTPAHDCFAGFTGLATGLTS